jgi:hypothetical protein
MKVESKSQGLKLNNSAKKEYFLIIEVMNQERKVNTSDIKKLYRTLKKKIPNVPNYYERKGSQSSSDADLEDNLEES